MDSDSHSDSSQLQPRFGGVLFNGMPPRAGLLGYEYLRQGSQTGISFVLDDRFSGTMKADWSDVGGPPSEAEACMIDLALVSLVAQHALPARIAGPRVPPIRVQRPLSSLLQLLYDVRAFCDETPFRNRPDFTGEVPLTEPPGLGPRTNPRRVLALLSGGFDSTFAAVLLREAGYEVIGLHVRCNRHVEQAEENAARSVAEKLDFPLLTVRLDAPDQERLGRFYSRTFGQFPFYNSIPHGRDFPLAAIAGVLARRFACGRIAFGHEKESRKKVISFRSKQIHRHDVESARGCQITSRFLRSALGSEVELFSPLAGLSIYRVRASLLRSYPRLAELVQSCFWSTRCEKCLKCLSTYTMQRHVGVEVSTFKQNPFADRDDQDMALLAEPDRPTEALAYGPQMHYAMKRIIEEGKARTEDYWLHRFELCGLPKIEANWKAIESTCLNADRVPEVPEDIHAVIEGLQ